MSVAPEEIDYIKMLADKINQAIEAEGEKRLVPILCALQYATWQHIATAPEDEREGVAAALPRLITFMQAGGTMEQAQKMLREIDAENRRAQMQLVPKTEN